MKIGLSYDRGLPSSDRYRQALFETAWRSGIELELIWLAGLGRGPDIAAIDGIDGLVLPGGSDVDPHRYGYDDPDGVCNSTPDRDDAEWAILDAAFTRRLPILAICRGMQLLNVYQGGTLLPDLPGHAAQDDMRHAVVCEAGSALEMLVGRNDGTVNSSHHQAVNVPGKGLQVAARDPDGVIEAIEWINPVRKPWLAAVQWHPERMALDDPFSGPIFRGFLQAASL